MNNNYTIDSGVDVKFMNQMGYRIINQNNVMTRIKPNCSSKVTCHSAHSVRNLINDEIFKK